MTVTALALDERKHRAALEALLAAELGPGVVYRYSNIPGAYGHAGSLPPIFVLLGIERRYAEVTRAGGTNRSGWRISVRYVGRTENEADWAAYHSRTALENKRLTIDGRVSNEIEHESSEADGPDDDWWFSGQSFFTYRF